MTSTKLIVNLVLALCFLSLFVHAQNNTSTEPTPSDSDSPSESGIDKALAPLYQMTNGFLKTVFPAGLRFDTIKKVKDTLTQESQVEGWPLTQTILNGYAGFATCVVVGFLMMIFMPFIGCICCCCRLCNKCGGKTQEVDPKNGKCKRILCAGLLLVFTLITIGGMVMVFFSAARMYELIDKKIVDVELNNQLNALGSSLQTKVDEDIVNKTDALLDGLKFKVETFLDDSSKTLTGAFLNLTHVEEPVTKLSNVLGKFNTSLLSLVESLEEFEDIRKTTAANYTKAQTLIQGTALGSSTAGQTLVGFVQNLTDQINSFTVQQVIDDINVNATAKLDGIPNLEQAYKLVNESVSSLIESKIQKPKRDILGQVNSTTDDISNQVNSIGQDVGQIVVSITAQGEAISKTLNTATKYASYGWYGCIGLGSIIALITLLYLCGLMFGVGSRPGEGTCSKGIGANFILAAIGFTFIFYSLLMLVTTVVFSTGSLATTHVCWVLQKPAPYVTALESDDLSFPGLGNITLLTIVKAYSDCLDGKTLEDILDYTDIGFDKSQITDQIDDNLGYDQINKQIKDLVINTSGINFLPQSLNDSLLELRSYNGFDASLVPNLTDHVDTIKDLLNKTIVTLTTVASLPGVSLADQTALNESADIFTHSRDTGVDTMARSADSIRANITQLSEILELLKNVSKEAFDDITEVENVVKNNGSHIVKEILSEHARKLSKDVSADANAGIDELFGTKCDDLANHLRDTGNVLCNTALNPLNGLWFSLGWSLFSMIPCMIAGFVLANLFRRKSSLDGDFKDDLNRDYDSEHIPLERHY